ncbi:MAG: hypothetical protein WDM86_01475 [Rhizomicrobium sp.]
MRELERDGGYVRNSNGFDAITPFLTDAFAKHYAIILIGVLICTSRVLRALDHPPGPAPRAGA